MARVKLSSEFCTCFSSLTWMKAVRPRPSTDASRTAIRRSMTASFSRFLTRARQGEGKADPGGKFDVGQARVLATHSGS